MAEAKTKERRSDTVGPSWGARLVGIEGLRALAATSVLMHHAILHASVESGLGTFGQWAVPNLASGLTLFFTLSGFLLYRPFASAVLSGQPLPSTRAYLRNRALRILPAYWVILLCVAVLKPISDPLILIQNMFLLQNYTPSGVTTGIAPAWSLCVEVVFYITLPMLAIAALKLAQGRAFRGRLAAALVPAAWLLALGIAGKIVASLTMASSSREELVGHTWHAVFERSFVAQADLFAFGMAAAVIVIAADATKLNASRRVASLAGGAFVAITLVVGLAYSLWGLNERPYNTIIAFACGLLLLWLVLPGRRRKSRAVSLLTNRLVVRVGVISYSLYLWHDPIIGWLNRHHHLGAGPTGAAVNIAVVMAISVVAATFTYIFVEAPAMRNKARMVPIRIPVGSAPESAAMEAAP